MKKAVSVILTLSLFLLAACSLEPPMGEADKFRQQKEFTIGLSVSTLNNPFFVSLKRASKKKLKTGNESYHCRCTK